jgi:ComF family protein
MPRGGCARHSGHRRCRTRIARRFGDRLQWTLPSLAGCAHRSKDAIGMTDYRTLSNFGGREFDSVRSRAHAQRQLARRLCASALRRALPQGCALCAAASGDSLLCAGCVAAMPRSDPACSRCALPGSSDAVCGACLVAPPPFAATTAAWRYAFPADRLLQAFKYRAALALADAFADALATTIVAHGAARPDVIVAMPLSPARQRSRGFNHAQEIARGVAARLGLDSCRVLRRVGESPPQAGLARTARAINVRGAIAAAGRVDGASIAIIDDVMTTGATMTAAASALREAGARRVDAWVVARTPATGGIRR